MTRNVLKMMVPTLFESSKGKMIEMRLKFAPMRLKNSILDRLPEVIQVVWSQTSKFFGLRRIFWPRAPNSTIMDKRGL
jgi:hypothetical protein